MRFYITVILILSINLLSMTLKEAFDLSGPGEGYDKLVVLEKGKLYTGGLFLGYVNNPFTFKDDYVNEINVRIKGNGAIIDLQNGQIQFGNTPNILDIDSCVIINGTLRYCGTPDGMGGYFIPYGSVKNITFYNSIDYGVRMDGAGKNMFLNNNLVVNCISTGIDFPFNNSFPSLYLKTGTSFAFSPFEWYGYPLLQDNWSYNVRYADEPMIHFSML